MGLYLRNFVLIRPRTSSLQSNFLAILDLDEVVMNEVSPSIGSVPKEALNQTQSNNGPPRPHYERQETKAEKDDAYARVGDFSKKIHLYSEDAAFREIYFTH